jgi:2-polyprenyl-3-methyl-5-hydroxy-6-metoxy-1,4-benzoquinol methylase
MDRRLKRHDLGYWEIADKPTMAELQVYYANKYYQESKGSYAPAYSEGELAYFNGKLEQRWHALKSLHSQKASGAPMRVLDVGCGEGYALAFFRAQGCEVRGFDFSAAGVESKNPSCKDALVVGDVFGLLQKEIFSGKKYDVVWLQNVLEHVRDPIDLLQSLRKLVDGDGVAVVTVPNDCSIIQRAALQYEHVHSAFWVLPPDHLSYFDAASLRAIARHTGWNCTKILGDFPVDWFLFHSGSNYVRDKSLGKDAHQARVQIENLIHTQPIDASVEFWAAAGQLGIGRNLTAFLTSIR